MEDPCKKVAEDPCKKVAEDPCKKVAETIGHLIHSSFLKEVGPFLITVQQLACQSCLPESVKDNVSGIVIRVRDCPEVLKAGCSFCCQE